MTAPSRLTIKSGERALTVADVAALTGFSRDTITRLFEREPGVLILARPSGSTRPCLTDQESADI